MANTTLAKFLAGMLLLGFLLFGYVILRPLPGTLSTTHKQIDVSSMKPGELRKIDDLEVPVWVLRRTPEMMSATVSTPLDGPDTSCHAKAPEFFVFVPVFEIVNLHNGIRTVLGVEEAAPGKPSVVEGDFPGGFKDNAGKGLYFDYSGRVLSLKSQSYWLKSASNLFVPECKYIGENKFLVNIEGVLSNIERSYATKQSNA